MANDNTATPFGPVGIMSPTIDACLGFCKPMFEGIFLFSSELAASMERPPYYGDEITLGFWEKLNMEFGSPSTNIKVVCIGNSLTEGYGGSGTSYPSVWKELSGYDIVNAGYFGDTSSGMLARFNTDVISESPDYCIIGCGINDYITGISLSTCKSNIDDMVALCLANNIEPRFIHYIPRENQLILAGISNINDMIDYMNDLWDYIKSLGYPHTLLNDSTDYNISNANMSYFFNDYIHPNGSGYYQWANQIQREFFDISKSSSSIENEVYPLNEGWKYKYYYTPKRFVILDENDNTIYDKYDVTVVSQFPIDYSVHKNHQFEIIIGDASETSTFYIPAVLVKKIYGDSPAVNNGVVTVINNCYLPNAEFSNYLDTDCQRIEQIYEDSYMEYSFNPSYELVKYPSTIGGTQGHIGIDFVNKAIPSSQVYEDNFIPFYAIKVPVTFKACMLQYRWILAIMGLTMFPMLEPILRPEEEQNNRPVYEPWLIWGVFKFLGNHEYDGPYYPWDDEDTPNIDVLDGVSPNWSY